MRILPVFPGHPGGEKLTCVRTDGAPPIPRFEMSLAPGDRIDRYEVLDLLGSGGMGEVYRARDPKLERHVALKVLHVDQESGTGGGARVLREARAVAALSHPNVLAVYDVGEVLEPAALRGLPYIAMELVVGTSLRTYVGDASVSIERRVGWLRDVARALAAAHESGVVHRDVKPENVMIRFDDVVKVLDFGIARRASPVQGAQSPAAHSLATSGTDRAMVSTLSAQGAGTPLYMAPEQLRAEPLDGRVDQFAWGVMAYELLTGDFPWTRNAGALALAVEILSVHPRAPRDVSGMIPASVSASILRALAKEPIGRFPSMVALLEALDAPEGTSIVDAPRAAASGAHAASVPVPPRGPGGSRPWSRWVVGMGLLGAGAALATAARSGNLRQLSSPTPPSTVAAAPGCTSNAECSRAHGGDAWRCQSERHACVPLASQDCKVYAEPGESQNEEMVWLGGLFPLSTEPAFDCESQAADLARREFAQVLGSSAGRSDAMHTRPVGLVLCDEGADPQRAARHLAQDVEAPAVIGFRNSKTALATIPPIFIPHHTLSFLSISQGTDLTRIPQPEGEPRLVWRSTLNASSQLAPTRALIADVLEPMARTRPEGLGRRPMKVAIVSSKRTGELSAGFRAIHFNGKTALENGDDFKQFVLGQKEEGRDEELAGALSDFHPQVIYVLPPDFTSRVLVSLETRWRGGPLPFYVVGPTFEPAALEFIGNDETRRRRFWSITNVSTRTNNAEFVLRYNNAFPEKPVTRTTAPQPSYDAFYVLADAVLALGRAPVTGPSLSSAITRLLPPGKAIDVGPAGIFDAVQTLRSGGGIDLDGAIGGLDFDPTTGEAPIDYALLCCGVDDRGRASGSIESGVVWDARAEKLSGALRCP